MIDVHVLTWEKADPRWLDQCLESLAKEPCTVYLVDNSGRTIGQGRADGYLLGTHPYVAHVDCDDYVLPGVMDVVCEALQAHQSVVTMERVEYQGRDFLDRPWPKHNMFAAHRSVVAPMLDDVRKLNWMGDTAIKRHLKPHQLDFVGYVWRLHPLQAHKKLTPEMMRDELAGFPWPTH